MILVHDLALARSLDKMDLTNLPLLGCMWTWLTQKTNPACARIDRFLVSTSYQLQILGICQMLLPRVMSYHFPVSLEFDGIRWAPCSFNFEDN